MQPAAPQTLNLDLVGRTLEAPEFTYDWKTCATYALGIGAGPEELSYLWEGTPGVHVYPGFAVVPVQGIVMDALARIGADFRTLVHGEQTLRLHRPFDRAGVLRSTGRVSAVHDKGKAAVVVIDTTTHDANGQLVAETTWSIFCRGQGGFGGEPGPSPVAVQPLPDAPPAFTAQFATQSTQALLYRLSGDLNPLHVDPALATRVGFEAPILHGLCSYGFAARALVLHLGGGDPARLRSFSARFSGVVYPGTIVDLVARPTDVAGRFAVEARVGDRLVLSHGVAELA